MSAEDFAKAREQMSTTVDKDNMYNDMEMSKSYAENRPNYSDEMFKVIVDYCKETLPTLNLAVDVGCGPGMSTLGFAKYFKKVIGVDVSPTQIACAPKDVPNAEFKVGYSDKLPFIANGTVDLLCTGESFNLMPHKETFAEADRVLRPGGTMAIFGYVMPQPANPEIGAVFAEWYLKMLPYWPKESQMIFDKFANLKFPYPGVQRREDLTLRHPSSLKKWWGTVNSTFPARHFREKYPNDTFLEDNQRKLTEVVKRVNNGSEEFDLIFDIFIIMGHKPKN